MPSPTGRIAEKSTSDLQAAIRSDSASTGEITRRVTSFFEVRGWYQEPVTPQAVAAAIQQFQTALATYPTWAVIRAFDRWLGTGTRWPSPAEIAILAGREVQPVTDELARRQKHADRLAAEAAERLANRCSAEAAARILAEAGLDPQRIGALKRFPAAQSIGQAQAMAEEADTPKPPREMTDAERAALEEARHNNAAIRESRQRAADRAGAMTDDLGPSVADNNRVLAD
jgi:hypothetical protein